MTKTEQNITAANSSESIRISAEVGANEELPALDQQWFMIHNGNSEPQYGWGHSAHANEYAEIENSRINAVDDFSRFYACPMSREEVDEIGRDQLEDQGFNLDDVLRDLAG